MTAYGCVCVCVCSLHEVAFFDVLTLDFSFIGLMRPWKRLLAKLALPCTILPSTKKFLRRVKVVQTVGQCEAPPTLRAMFVVGVASPITPYTCLRVRESALTIQVRPYPYQSRSGIPSLVAICSPCKCQQYHLQPPRLTLSRIMSSEADAGPKRRTMAEDSTSKSPQVRRPTSAARSQ